MTSPQFGTGHTHRTDRQLAGLRQALNEAGVDVVSLQPMADTGLAHDHVWLHRRDGDDWVARLPKQSQMDLGVADNLTYQAACFQRAAQGGHAPTLHTVLPPSESLPRGGLLVSAIEGRAARLPDDLPAIARALASFHALALPSAAQRPPLHAPEHPWQALLTEIEAQAAYLPQARLDAATAQRITDEIECLHAALDERRSDAKTLISFDAHPGNFLITAQGEAILVDLEKCRYGIPGMDLAHASLYTSTTWDPASHAVLGTADIRRFTACWIDAMRDARRFDLIDTASLLEARRGMWLWSLTWCAKWRVLHTAQRDAQASGEDWSASLSEDALIAHVAERVDHYLSPSSVVRVLEERAHLARHFPRMDR
nr:aminoglycoside phosphotransferase family protein [uncultured Halomonas sp.]